MGVHLVLHNYSEGAARMAIMTITTSNAIRVKAPEKRILRGLVAGFCR